MWFDLKTTLIAGGRRTLITWALILGGMLLFLGVVQGRVPTLVVLAPLALVAFKMSLRMHAGGTLQAAVAPHLPKKAPGRVRDTLFFEDPEGRDPLVLVEAFGRALEASGVETRFMGGLDVTRGGAHHVVTPAPVAGTREMRIDSSGASEAERAAFIESFKTHLAGMGVVAAGSARPDPERLEKGRGFGRRGF